MKNKYLIEGERTTIYVVCQDGTVHEVYIDTKNIPKLEGYTVGLARHYSCTKLYYYAIISKQGKKTYLHRHLLNCPNELQINHIDNNGLNDTESNMQIVTNAENAQNKINLQPNNTSGIRGVFWCNTTRKWRARVKLNQKDNWLGYFDNLEDAAKVVNDFRKEHMQFSQES
jgi:hypothetical protein